MTKIIITGPESSGKSTLCKALSLHFKIPFNEEFARVFLDQLRRQYEKDDLLKIFDEFNKSIDSYQKAINIKPDFQVLRQKFKDNMKEVLSKVNQLKIDELSNIVNARKLEYQLDQNITIDYSDFIVEETGKEGFEVSSNNLFKVGINTMINEDLKLEGMIRDLIRQVQNFRKESGLEVSDRINISITFNQELNDAVKKYKKYFMNEVLGVNIRLDGKVLGHSKDIVIMNQKLVLSLSKENSE